jgi:hypothetical protein
LLVTWLHGAAGATDLPRKQGLPLRQSNDVFGVEPGMSLVEVRKVLAARFPGAFGGCAGLLESLTKITCRVTAQAYYEEVPGRTLGRQLRPEDAQYVSNLVLTVDEGDAKRSIEVFFGSAASGREAYRISGTTRYVPSAQPLIAEFEAEFIKRFGPLLPSPTRRPGTISRAYFARGVRLTGPDAADAIAACQEMASAANHIFDVRGMADRGFARNFANLPCDSVISVSMAPGLTGKHLEAVTIAIFDALRMARIFELEMRAAADAESILSQQGGPRPLKGRDF